MNVFPMSQSFTNAFFVEMSLIGSMYDVKFPLSILQDDVDSIFLRIKLEMK